MGKSKVFGIVLSRTKSSFVLLFSDVSIVNFMDKYCTIKAVRIAERQACKGVSMVTLKCEQQDNLNRGDKIAEIKILLS